MASERTAGQRRGAARSEAAARTRRAAVSVREVERALHRLYVESGPSGAEAGPRAAERAAAMGLPRAAEVRRPFVQSFVDGERVLRLEAVGYRVEVVPFVPRSVTAHNLLVRARRAREPVRMAEAEERRRRLLEPLPGP